jgi:SAM-dependent methyltransferase
MLDLVRLGSRRLFPPGGEDLYRQVALLTGLAPGMELLDVACGRGIALEYFVREFGVQGSGVDTDSHFIAEAEAYSRKEGLVGEMSFQEASPGDLPFRDETFDVVVGELGLAATVDPREAVRELARVTRPGGQVVLIQLVWKAPVEEDRRQILSDHLGARPLMVVELRRVLMDAEVGEILVEDWTNDETAFRPQVKMPFPEFAELFTLWEKLGILLRAWRRWGWRGVRTVFQREAEVHLLLTKERLLGLNLLKGVKAQTVPEESVEMPDTKIQEEEEKDLPTPDLPLFGSDAEEKQSSS